MANKIRENRIPSTRTTTPCRRFSWGEEEAAVYSKHLLVGLLCLASFVFPGLLQAQSTNIQGYDIQRFQPATDGQGVMSVQGTKTLGHLKSHVGLYTGLSQGLLAAGNPVNAQSVEIVDTFLTGDFLFGIGLGNRLNLGVDLPVFFFERGRNFNTAAPFNTLGLGDIRMDLKLNLLQERLKAPGLALLSSVYFPTGETSKFTGSKGVRYEGKLILDKQWEHFYLSANVGCRFVPQQTVAGLDADDELTFGVGARIPLPVWDQSLSLIGEVYGATVIKGPKEITTPIEVLGGLRKSFNNNLALTVAGGAGLTGGSGSPQYRALAGLSYTLGSKKFEPSRFGRKSVGGPAAEVYFAFNRDTFLPKWAKVLDRMVTIFRENPGSSIVISTGHSDSNGSEGYNLKLSLRRARNVASYLIKRGVPVDRIKMEGRGETEPVADNRTKEGKSKNRRVEVRVKYLK